MGRFIRRRGMRWRIRPFALEEIPSNRTLALLACVSTYHLALCDDMTFHPGIHLAPLCVTAQIQFAIKSEDLERIPMRARGRTRTFLIGLAKIICAVHAFWRTAFGN